MLFRNFFKKAKSSPNLKMKPPNIVFDGATYNTLSDKISSEKIFDGQNFRHQAEISTVLSDFCLTFVLNYWTKFSTDKMFRRTKFLTPSWNFDTFVRFLSDFCIEILDKIFDGQNFSTDKIFDTKPKFWQFCPTNFCPTG